MNEQIYLFGIPIPPSSNNMYASIVRNGKMLRVPAKEFVQYKKAFDIWCFQNKRALNSAREMIVQWNSALSVSTHIGFEKSRLLTKKGTLKKLDTTNRLKILHDLLADAIGIDDKEFVYTPAEKMIAGKEEMVVVIITPTELRVLDGGFGMLNPDRPVH